MTSLLGVSLSMVDFFADGCKQMSLKSRRSIFCLLTFFPPLLFTLFNPEIFMTALGIAGGLGESFLNALLPISLVWISRYMIKQQGDEIPLGKSSLVFLGFLALSAMGIELLHLAGVGL